jgi:hypothetical protein
MRLTLLLTPTLATAYQLFGAAHTPCLRAEPCLRADAVRCIASIDKPAVVNLPAEPFVPAARLQGSDKPTVWGEFGALAVETGATNLGQGFPDWQPPDFVVEEVQKALREGYHQYTRPAGHPQLVEVLAQRYSKHMGRTIDPMSEVATTVGASQALYMSLQALIDPGDEVHCCLSDWPSVALASCSAERAATAARVAGGAARAGLRPVLWPGAPRWRQGGPRGATARRDRPPLHPRSCATRGCGEPPHRRHADTPTRHTVAPPRRRSVIAP